MKYGVSEAQRDMWKNTKASDLELSFQTERLGWTNSLKPFQKPSPQKVLKKHQMHSNLRCTQHDAFLQSLHI